ncbi:MAG: coproporphyrinogen-III oxidase family protein [Deltaproteobacteria bacterium]|nr:coproporphyrinogen-III oxidase family protein [Deltaproteobacteria bacterium]
MKARPRGVYAHVPFCRRRCPYCDFAIEVGVDPTGFVDAIARELERRRHEIEWPVQTVSLGGGTPSSLPPAELARLLQVIGPVDADAERSLEVNPEDIDEGTASGLREAGFTRVSVGLQSFDDSVLRYLGRAHDGAGGSGAIEALVRSGVDVGVDLIVGVPGEGPSRLERDIERAAGLGVGHVSAYLLTVEAGTPLVQLIASHKRAAVDDDAQAAAYERVQGLCAAAGFQQYEVSSYARPGKTSRHNRLYWQRGDYLGLGPGAHSFAVLDDGSVRRRHNRARFAAWKEDCDADVDVEVLEPAHALREALAFGLRDQAAGVDVEGLAALHCTPLTAGVAAALRLSIERGDVVVRGQRHHLGEQGVRFADRVARAILQAR